MAFIISASSGGSGGIGDVVGPASATDNAIARYNTATGKLLQNSAVIVDDSGNMTGVASLTVTTLIATATITTGDNLIILNDDVAGAPSENAGIEIERGTSANVNLLWNETSDLWTAGVVGSLLNIVRASTEVVDNTLPRWNGTTDQLQNSGITVDDSDNVTGVEDLTTSITGNISSPGAGTGSEKFGSGAVASANNTVAIGNASTASGLLSVAVGQGATASSKQSVALGQDSTCATGDQAIAIGRNSSATGAGSIAIGRFTVTSGIDGIAIGRQASHSRVAGIAIGADVILPSNNSLVIGSDTSPIKTVYIGENATSATAATADLQFGSTSGLGTNIGGADFTLVAGQGTGTGAGGSLKLQTAAAGSTGSSLNSLATHFEITGEGALGFFGATPVAQSATYAPTNVTPDRAFDANSTTTAELADVLGTLIADLKALGLIG